MIEILLAAGFTDKGLCAVCGGRAHKFIKGTPQGNAEVTLKQGQNTFLLRYRGEIVKGNAANLQQSLTARNLA